ncbi:uncharacterized protein LOC144107177 isoform X2 [Amblyomma americanum]
MRPESATTAAAALVRAAKERLAARQTTRVEPRRRPTRPPVVSRRTAAVRRTTKRTGKPEASRDSTSNGTYRKLPSVRRCARNGGGSSYRGSSECGRLSNRSVSTWTVQMGEVPISYVSRESWYKQPRPERGQPLASVDKPFHGLTLEERHPYEPKATYSQAELRSLCPVCGTLVIHWKTHVAGQLHYDKTHPEKGAGARGKVNAMISGTGNSAMPTQVDVAAALRVLQVTRPDVIAASLRLALPEQALCSSSVQHASSRPAPLPPPLSRRSQWDPVGNNRSAPLPGSSDRVQSRPFVKREESAGRWPLPRGIH